MPTWTRYAPSRRRASSSSRWGRSPSTCGRSICRCGWNSPRSEPDLRSGPDGLQHALRLGDAIPLRVVNAQVAQHLDDLGILGELGDGQLAGQMSDLVDGAHHLAVDGIAQDFPHEAAVDLQVIDREVLEVAER